MLLQRPGEDTLPSFFLLVCVSTRAWLCSYALLCVLQCALCVLVCRLGASAFSFGLRQTSVYYVFIIVLGHKSHKGILPPCKLILCYYQFTSATLWKWNLAGESNRKVTICLDEIFFFKSLQGEKRTKFRSWCLLCVVFVLHSIQNLNFHHLSLDLIYSVLFLIHEPLRVRLSTDQQPGTE